MVADTKNFKNSGSGALTHLCLDIETCHLSEEEQQRELELGKPPGSYKSAEAIARWKAEYALKVKEKSALLDPAPIGCIAVGDESGDVAVFHWLKVDSGQHEHFFSIKTATERDMLVELRKFLDECASTDPGTAIVGFNLNFDLPHLRIAYVRHGLKLPNILLPKSGNPIADVMQLYTRYFTSKDAPFIGLAEVVRRLGIDGDGKGEMNGAMAPDYIARGFGESEPVSQFHQDVVSYCALDVLMTMRAYLIMTGQAGD